MALKLNISNTHKHHIPQIIPIDTQSTLIATAAADAHGLVVENLTTRRILRLYPGGLPPFGLLGGRGFISDDTEHAAITAQAFAASGGNPDVFESQLSWRLRKWFWALPAATGLATGRALIKLSLGFGPARSGVKSAGNGPCMRAPILGSLVEDPDLLWELTLRSSRITHTDHRAIQGAFVVARWTQMAKQGQQIPTIDDFLEALSVDHVPLKSEVRATLLEVKHSLEMGEPIETFVERMGWKHGPTGYVMHTLPAAIHMVFAHKGDWEATVRRTVMLGGDTDTVAALVGGMLSVLPGQTPPQAWLDNMSDWPRTLPWLNKVEDSAKEVARRGLNQSSLEVMNPPEVCWLACLGRNLVFLGVVLAYGVRRLLPPY